MALRASYYACCTVRQIKIRQLTPVETNPPNLIPTNISGYMVFILHHGAPLKLLLLPTFTISHLSVFNVKNFFVEKSLTMVTCTSNESTLDARVSESSIMVRHRNCCLRDQGQIAPTVSKVGPERAGRVPERAQILVLHLAPLSVGLIAYLNLTSGTLVPASQNPPTLSIYTSFIQSMGAIQDTRSNQRLSANRTNTYTLCSHL